MGKFIELTARFDSTNPALVEGELTRVLVDVDSIQAVTMGLKSENHTEVTLVPSIAAFGSVDGKEPVVQGQRTLVVIQPYLEIFEVLDQCRGVVRCIPKPHR